MGKGDKRSRRGKIFAGSHGKTRPKHKNAVVIPKAKPKAAAEAPVTQKPAPKIRKKAAAPEAVTETPAEIIAEPPAETVTETPAEAPAEETPAGEPEAEVGEK